MLHGYAAMSGVTPQVFQQQNLLSLCTPKLPSARIFQTEEGEQRKAGKHGVRGQGGGMGGGQL